MSTLQTVMALTAAAAVGTAYVLIHEHRRKLKTHRKKAAGAGRGGGDGQRSGQSSSVSRDLLLAILAESATAAFQLIEQVRSACACAPGTLPKQDRPRAKNGGHWKSGLVPELSPARSRAVTRTAARQTRKMVHLKHKQTGCTLEEAVDELQKDFEVAMQAVVSAIRQKHGVSEPQMTQVLMEYQADSEVQTGVQTLRDVRLARIQPLTRGGCGCTHAHTRRLTRASVRLLA